MTEAVNSSQSTLEQKPDKLVRELRCTNCRRLICYEYIRSGFIRYVCPRCGEVNEFTFKTPQEFKKFKSAKIELVSKNSTQKGGD